MRFSANLPSEDMAFLDELVESGKFPNRTAALVGAIELLRQTHPIVRISEWEAVGQPKPKGQQRHLGTGSAWGLKNVDGAP